MLVLVAIGASAWFLVIRDRVIAKKFGVVVPQEVFRSGQISRYLIGDVIDRHQLGAIINLNGLDHLDADQLSEIDAAKARGVRYYRFPLKGDATGDIDRYASAVAAIVDSQKNRIPVLVHCAAGAQRTGACVAFYRLLMRRDPPDRVIEELRHYGWNPRYDRVLVDYVNAHMGELAALLVQRGLLKEVPEVLPALHP
jgi:protein tyrosine/serine phosphatase